MTVVRDPELDAALDSLKAVQVQLVEVLVLAGVYLETLAEDDERAASLVRQIDAAFDGLVAENIGAASMLAERENGR